VPTLVCCAAGMSRSVCVAAAGVVLAEGWGLDESLVIVAGSGPADVSPGLLAQLRGAIEPE
jgi:protein-tyrosine phosphatase